MNNSLLASASAFALITLALTPAGYAQERDEDDEIIVTARKRAETLLEVPSSATVITAENAQNQILDDIEDFVRQIPGAVGAITGAEENGDILFRGQGAGRTGDAVEAATGVYRNGIYIAGGSFGGRTFNRLDLFDFERVEALRGPQSALYGRNAVGGAVNIVNRRPSDEFSIQVNGGYRFESDETRVDGVVNLPVSDQLALRVGGFRYHQDGYISLVDSDVNVDERRFHGLRVAARLDDFWGDATFDLTGEYYHANLPSQASTGFSVSAGDPDFFTRDNLDSLGRTNVEEYRGVAEFEKTLGFATLTVAGVYTTREGARENEDLDHFSPLQPSSFMAEGNVMGDFEKYGGEARLASNMPDSRWSWLIGADIQSSEETTGRRQIRRSSGVIPRDEMFTEDLFSVSVFGSLDYDVTDKLNIGVEGRMQWDEKDLDGLTNVRLAAGGGVFVPAGTTFEATDEFSGFTPSVNVIYQATPSQSIFARFATGYRPGGFNQSAIVRANSPEQYEREYAYSGEAGWKGRLFDNAIQIELAGFYTYTDDVQVVSRVDSGIGVFILQNAGDQDTYGFEADIRGRKTIGAGVLRGSIGFATAQGDFRSGAEIVNGPGGALLDISGNRISRTRDYTANYNIAYSHPIGGDLRLTVSTGAQFEGGGFENAPNTQVLDAFAIFDARATLAAENWRMSVFAKNFTDDIYIRENVSGNLFLSAPRTIGVDLGLSF